MRLTGLSHQHDVTGSSVSSSGRLRALGVCCESVGKGRGAEGVLGTIQQVRTVIGWTRHGGNIHMPYSLMAVMDISITWIMEVSRLP